MNEIQIHSKHRSRNYTGEKADDCIDHICALLGVTEIITNQPIEIIKKTINSDVKDVKKIDPHTLLKISAMSENNIFIADNDVYSREEIYNKYPFKELKTTPENVFIQQKIHIFNELKNYDDGPNPELISADITNNEVLSLKDTMAKIKKKQNHISTDVKTGTILSKVFIAKTAFEDFKIMCRTIRSTIAVTGSTVFAQLIAGDVSLDKFLLEDSTAVVVEEAKTNVCDDWQEDLSTTPGPAIIPVPVSASEQDKLIKKMITLVKKTEAQHKLSLQYQKKLELTLTTYESRFRKMASENKECRGIIKNLQNDIRSLKQKK